MQILFLVIINLRWTPIKRLQISFMDEYMCTGILRKLTLLARGRGGGGIGKAVECVRNPPQVRNGEQWSINPMLECACAYVCMRVHARQDASNGRAHPLMLIVKSKCRYHCVGLCRALTLCRVSHVYTRV